MLWSLSEGTFSRCSRFTSVEMTPQGNEAPSLTSLKSTKTHTFTCYPPDWSPIARVGSTTFVVSGIMNRMPKDLVCMVEFQTNINKRQAGIHQPRFSNRRSKNAIHTSWTFYRLSLAKVHIFFKVCALFRRVDWIVFSRTCSVRDKWSKIQVENGADLMRRDKEIGNSAS